MSIAMTGPSDQISLADQPSLDRVSQADQDLLARSLRGDQEAFAALYARRQGFLYRFGLRMTGSEAVAEDVTQETFLAVITHGHRYDASRGTVAAFLYGITRNLLLRRLERDRARDLDEAGSMEAAGDPLEDLTRQETVDHVRRAVLSLPLPFREVVVLCSLQDASYEEAAAALGCPIGTVRSRLSRARRMLARKLKRPEMTLVKTGGRSK